MRDAKKITFINVLTVITILLFVVFRFPYFIGNVYVYDESWHTEFMHNLRLYNEQSFGAAYWVFGFLIHKISINHKYFSSLLLRLFSFSSICLSFWLLYKLGRENAEKFSKILLMFFITTPVVWFGGKLITPEFYQLGLLAIAAYYIFTRSCAPSWTIILLGFTIRLKLSALLAVACIIGQKPMFA